MATRTYLDAGVQRIGDYLTRVPKLAELRNASALISAATATDGGLLDGLPVLVNDETGHADGVIHLRVDPGHDPRAVAGQLLVRLRDRLPGAQLAASWAAGADYAEAFALMHSPSSDQHLLWLPSTNEFPLARPCGGHSADGAAQDDRGCGSRPGMASGQPGALCPDCRSRSKRGSSGRGSSGRGSSVRGNPGRIGSGQGAGQPAGVPRDSRAESLLASLGSRPTEIAHLCPKQAAPPRSNHVATIAMDGNGVGGVFAELLGSGSADARQAVSAALGEAMQAAFLAAAGKAIGADGQVNVIPVVLGGDDLIAIVAAVDAWAFARTIVTQFSSEVTSRLPAQLAGGLSLSGGITFHKVKHPITSAIQTSDALMRRAKRAHNGSAAAFCWIDLTGDTLDEAPDLAVGLARRPVATAAALQAQDEQLQLLAQFPQSALSNLRGIIEQLDVLPVSDADRRSYVLAQAARVGAEKAVTPFAYPDDSGAGPAGPVTLASALDLARWWR